MAFKHNVGGTRPKKESSSRHHKEIGSGAKPHTSKHGIETSAPKKPHKLDGRGSGMIRA